MAVLAACASTAFTTSTTWALVSATGYLASEAATETLSTAYSSVRSQAFTPGAITIDGIGLKLAARIGTTGTISVNLEKDSDDSQVAGTEVTINVSDLQNATAVSLDGGWIFFKFAAPVLLVAATAYQVAAKTSTTVQVQCWRDATPFNISRYLRTTTTQAPAAADDLIVVGEYTAAGAATTLTVTMDNTATTDFGSAPTAANGLLSPGMAIGAKGVVMWGTTAATAYYLKLSNSCIVYNGGILNIGTTGTPMPRDSSAVLEFDPAADGDYGLLGRAGSTVNIQGLSRTVAKLVVSCKLNTDEAIAQTTLGVDTDTGWLDNDQIVVASTTQTRLDSELGALNGNAGASSLTVDGFAGAGGGLAVAHSGTSPTQAEVINITRNVKIRSATATLMTYVFFDTTSTVDIDWAEFYYLGDNAATKFGITISTTTGSFNMQFSSLHDCEDFGLSIQGAATNNITFSSNVIWSIASVTGPGVITTATTGTNIIFDSNIFIKSGALELVRLTDVGGTFTNNILISAGAAGVSLFEVNVIGTLSGNVVHSNGTNGFSLPTNASGVSGLVSTMTCWRNAAAGILIAGNVTDLTIDSPTCFGNGTDSISITSSGSDIHIKSPVLSGDTTFATTNGIRFSTAALVSKVLIDDGDFSTVTGIKTAHTNDINVAATLVEPIVTIRNTKLGAATEVATQSSMSSKGFISAEKLDQTSGNHKTWMRYGTLNTDAMTFNTAAPSMQMTPNNATNKLESAYQFQGIKGAVANGQTCAISVYVRKSATYNGNQPRLIQKANPALGQSADVVIDTMTVAVANWEQLTGTSSTANDDGAWEFVVDCNGTVGSVNVDDWVVTGTANDPGTVKFWFNGIPVDTIFPASAAGGGGMKLVGTGGLAG